MKKFVPIFLELLTTAANAEFSADMEHTKLLREFNVLTINDLGVGESGYIYALSAICSLGGGKIGVDKYKALAIDRNEYMNYMKVTRKPKGAVSLSMEERKPKVVAGIKLPGGESKAEALKSLVLSISRAEKCETEVFLIDEIEGVASSSELVKIIKKKIMKQNDNAEEKPIIPNSYSELEQTWMVSKNKSKIDDSTNVTLMLFSNEKVYGTFGSSRPTFVIRCKENKTEAYITTGRMLDSDIATIRLGGEKAYTLNMSKSTDGRALFFPSAISNIKKFWKYQEMVFRYTPYNSGDKTVTFNIAGLKREIAPLRKACHW